MPRGTRGKGGKRDVGQLNKTLHDSHDVAITAWQDYAQQTSPIAQSQKARNDDHLDTWTAFQGFQDTLHAKRGDSVTIETLAVQSLSQRSHSISGCSPTSQGARHQQSSRKQVDPVVGIITEDAEYNSNLKQVGRGINKTPQWDTIKMKSRDSRAVDGSADESNLTANGGSQLGGEQAVHTDTTGFFVDLVGSGKFVETGFPQPTVISSSSLPDPETDDEVIVFSGRSGKKEDVSDVSNGTKTSIPRPVHGDVAPKPLKVSSFPFKKLPSRSEIFMNLKSSQCNNSQAKGNTRANKRERRSRKNIDDDEILADYIANLQANDGAGSSLGAPQLEQRDLEPEVEEHESISDLEYTDEMRDSNVSWDSVDLKDFDGFSTSSEAMTATPRILAKRLRGSAVQYLVTRRGDPVDEARWLPLGSIQAADGADVIASFEHQALVQDECIDEDEEEDASSQSEAFKSQIVMDLAQDAKTLEDEKDLEDRQRARISDEQVARLFSKQAELGIMGDDLVLLDADALGMEFGGHCRAGRLENSRAKATHYSHRLKAHKKQRSRNRFLSADPFADILEQDSCDAFDIMDRERPSLRKKPKRHGKAEMDFNSSDPELQHSLEAAWEHDRTKKKLRKQEREELRAQGLLNKKGNLDLKAKYTEGISMNNVKSEIKAFLKSSLESQPLPPMGHSERKAVHDFANQASLKSKSVGSGVARFPVLYKTSRTKALTPYLESRIDAMLTPTKFLARLDKSRKRTAPPVKARTGALNATASYRDGEVVGIGAPELGVENKGRAMLEKMGWSTGTALGAVDNKGIAQPIAQIVKTSKAGLG